MVEVHGYSFGAAQPLAEADVTFMHRDLQAGDGALGNFGCGDQLADGRPQRQLIGLQELEPPIEHHAITDGQHKENCDQSFDYYAETVAHDWASIGLLLPPAVSNMAKVVPGLRSVLAIRTATRSPTRPIRPSVSVTEPQRTTTGASVFSSSISVSPTSSFMICFNGNCAS